MSPRTRTPKVSYLPLPQATPKGASKIASSNTQKLSKLPLLSPSPSPLPNMLKAKISTTSLTDEIATAAQTPSRIPRLTRGLKYSPVPTPSYVSLSHRKGLLPPAAARVSSGVTPSSPSLSSPILTTNSKSPYMFQSVADACVTGSLVHKLTCGHKVITCKPEACAANCCRALPQRVEKFANAEMTEEAFTCPGCVEEHVQLHLNAKRALLAQVMNNAKTTLCNLPPDYAKTRFSREEAEWDVEARWERRELLDVGRKCRYVANRDPKYQQFFFAKEPASATIAWPPRKRPKKSRSRGWTPGGCKVRRF